MIKINECEMKNIIGGTKIILITFASATISFLIGLFDGLINPKKCGS